MQETLLFVGYKSLNFAISDISFKVNHKLSIFLFKASEILAGKYLYG